MASLPTKIDLDRAIAEKSLLDFVREAWHVLEPGRDLKIGWTIEAMCDHLQAVTDGDINRLLMNVPPGSMKSLLVGVFWPAYEWLTMPSKRFMSTSYSQSLAIRDNRRCRLLITSEWYQDRFGDRFSLVGDQNQKGKFENDKSGFRESMAFESLTGSRGDCLLPGTMVATPDGEIPIEDIVCAAKTCHVLSYDGHTKRVVQRPIEAVARRSSPDFYRLRFTSGRVVECTGDHRIYTAKGYVQARFLSKGDVFLRMVPSGICQDGGRSEKENPAFLQPIMQNKIHQRCGAFDTVEDALALVERICEETEVYDIQVKDTRCFFANGILVHNCVILDDPHSVSSAGSTAKLQSALDTFNEALPSRLNDPEKSAIVVVMQRLHERDISGEIIKRDLGYDHLCIPMEYEPDRASTTSIGWTDPRTKEGELFFPERFPQEVVDRDKEIMGIYAVAAQFQQRPSPRGGGIFKQEWLKYWTNPPKIDWRVVIGDTAQKTKEQSDYSVFQCWGRSADGQAVLLDQVRGKWEAPELKVNARAFWAKHKAEVGVGHLRAMKVEDKVSGTGLIQELKREGIPILPIQRGVDKITRAYDAAPFIESGNVIFPSEAPWLADLLGEITAFPAGAHDDQVDPMMDAIVEICSTPAQYNIRAI